MYSKNVRQIFYSTSYAYVFVAFPLSSQARVYASLGWIFCVKTDLESVTNIDTNNMHVKTI